MPGTRWIAAVAAVVVAAVGGPEPAGAQAPTSAAPRYERTFADAVTSDNPPSAACPGPGPCVLPDPNREGPGGLVDSFTVDLYERPLRTGGQVVSAVDLVSARVGKSDEFHFYRMDLHSTEGERGLPYAYGFELDYDDGDGGDDAGDMMVTVDGPQLGPEFSTKGVKALWNRASTISGPTPGLPDEPGVLPPGFELPAFDAGRNLLAGAPGGADAVVARTAPDRAASIEVAVRRGFLVAVNEGKAVTKVAFRPDAGLDRLPMAAYSVHDRMHRAEAGSPFPFLARGGAPSSCPGTERGLPPAARMALDSGTTEDTGHPNPCYPVAKLAGYDNMTFATLDRRVAGTSEGEPAPDLAVTAHHSGDLSTGKGAGFTVSVRNTGTRATSGPVVLTIRLGAGLRPRAAGGGRWACSPAGRTVSCATRDELAPGEPSVVTVRAAVEARPGELRNHVDVATAGDEQPANNVAVDVARVRSGPRSPVPLPAGVVVGVAAAVPLLWLVASRRRRRDSEPAADGHEAAGDVGPGPASPHG